MAVRFSRIRLPELISLFRSSSSLLHSRRGSWLFHSRACPPKYDNSEFRGNETERWGQLLLTAERWHWKRLSFCHVCRIKAYEEAMVPQNHSSLNFLLLVYSGVTCQPCYWVRWLIRDDRYNHISRSGVPSSSSWFASPAPGCRRSCCHWTVVRARRWPHLRQR